MDMNFNTESNLLRDEICCDTCSRVFHLSCLRNFELAPFNDPHEKLTAFEVDLKLVLESASEEKL